MQFFRRFECSARWEATALAWLKEAYLKLSIGNELAFDFRMGIETQFRTHCLSDSREAPYILMSSMRNSQISAVQFEAKKNKLTYKCVLLHTLYTTF